MDVARAQDAVFAAAVAFLAGFTTRAGLGRWLGLARAGRAEGDTKQQRQSSAQSDTHHHVLPITGNARPGRTLAEAPAPFSSDRLWSAPIPIRLSASSAAGGSVGSSAH